MLFLTIGIVLVVKSICLNAYNTSEQFQYEKSYYLLNLCFSE